MLRSLAAGRRQCAWIVTWHAAASANHAKPGTGHCSRLAKEIATPTLHLCFLIDICIVLYTRRDKSSTIAQPACAVSRHTGLHVTLTASLKVLRPIHITATELVLNTSSITNCQFGSVSHGDQNGYTSLLMTPYITTPAHRHGRGPPCYKFWAGNV